MSYLKQIARDDDATARAMAVHDKYSPGVRPTGGPLYGSMTVRECINVLKALADVLAELQGAMERRVEHDRQVSDHG